MNSTEVSGAGAVPVTAIVPAHRRLEATSITLKRIEACFPQPDEILVHVDGGQTDCAAALRAEFPHLTILVSDHPLGPGGSRNRLVAAARNEVIASFDDDSYPVDVDFFARVHAVSQIFRDAAVIAASIYHRGEEPPADSKEIAPTDTYIACGAIIRRSEFLTAGGLVPVMVPYAMEEDDLALRLLDGGRKLFLCKWLRVFHDTDLTHHQSPHVTAGIIANIALRAWLRYPVRYWPYGILQVVNRVFWSLRAGRRAGIVRGLLGIPRYLIAYSHHRKTVSADALRRWWMTRVPVFEPFDPIAELASRSGEIPGNV
jgi:GT2 family glycosyltransferase